MGTNGRRRAPRTRRTTISAPPGIEVRVVRGKGRGVFALRRFRRGSLVERSPVIVLPPKEWRHLEKTRLGDYAFDWGRDDRACAMVLGLGSLYNHAREPNLVNRWNAALVSMDWIAARDIGPGEELTVDYRDGGSVERDPLWFRAL